MKIKFKGEFVEGYNSYTEVHGKHSDMMMDFGILKLKNGTVFEEAPDLERVYHIIYGEIEISWDGHVERIKRDSFLDDALCCLNVPKGMTVRIVGIADDSEMAIVRTENEKVFEPRLYLPKDAVIQTRGKDIMDGAGERVCKTLMDITMAPHSNIVIGEDVVLPGRWAGFPTHHHPQPEIYFFKFNPEQGFGFIENGDEVLLMEKNDVALITPGCVHPQVAAPGYKMFFIWTIRNLDGNPFTKPTMIEKHMWVENGAGNYWDVLHK